MKIAILADIHGNIHAFEAALADAEKQSPDQIVFGGDFCSKGPNPAEVIDLVLRSNYPGIVGNTDLDVLNRDGPEEIWMREQLGKDRLAYLQSLPMQKRIRPPNGRGNQDDLLIVHSTPRSCYDLLILNPKPNSSDVVFIQPTSAEESKKMLAGACANLIVYGHIHFTSQGVIDSQRVESIGSVGFPYDLDHRAAYAIVGWDREQRRWHLEHRRVDYEYGRVIADLKRSTHPFPERSIRMIQDARWYRGKKRSG